jgi:membrane protease YdiL (CAAX protease family)
MPAQELRPDNPHTQFVSLPIKELLLVFLLPAAACIPLFATLGKTHKTWAPGLALCWQMSWLGLLLLRAAKNGADMKTELQISITWRSAATALKYLFALLGIFFALIICAAALCAWKHQLLHWLLRYLARSVKDGNLLPFYLRGTMLPRLLLLVSLTLAAPLTEELFFRRFLYRSLRARMALWKALLISSVLFALVHPFFPTAFITGLLLAWCYEKHGNLGINVLMHAMLNSLILAGAVLMCGK